MSTKYSTAYIDYVIGIFSLTLDKYRIESNKLIDSVYSTDPFSLFHARQYLDSFFNQINSEVIQKLKTVVPLNLQPQAVVEALGHLLMEKAQESGRTLGYFSPFITGLTKHQINVTRGLAHLLFAVSKIDPQNIRNLGGSGFNQT